MGWPDCDQWLAAFFLATCAFAVAFTAYVMLTHSPGEHQHVCTCVEEG